jgi:hypothetical protein
VGVVENGRGEVGFGRMGVKEEALGERRRFCRKGVRSRKRGVWFGGILGAGCVVGSCEPQAVVCVSWCEVISR